MQGRRRGRGGAPGRADGQGGQPAQDCLGGARPPHDTVHLHSGAPLCPERCRGSEAAEHSLGHHVPLWRTQDLAVPEQKRQIRLLQHAKTPTCDAVSWPALTQAAGRPCLHLRLSSRSLTVSPSQPPVCRLAGLLEVSQEADKLDEVETLVVRSPPLAPPPAAVQTAPLPKRPRARGHCGGSLWHPFSVGSQVNFRKGTGGAPPLLEEPSKTAQRDLKSDLMRVHAENIQLEKQVKLLGARVEKAEATEQRLMVQVGSLKEELAQAYVREKQIPAMRVRGGFWVEPTSRSQSTRYRERFSARTHVILREA